MEYTVGSLSEIITGVQSSNKTKVIKKSIKLKQPKESTETIKPTNEKKKKQKPNVEPPKDLTKKRKAEETSDTVPSKKPKVPKNTTNALRRIHDKEKESKEVEDPELTSRTIFVGNLPLTTNTKRYEKLFSKYGKVESLRVRGVPVANPKTPKKIAMIKNEFHPERKSFFAYVRYETRDEALKAAENNGMVYKDHHLRIELCDKSITKADESRAIFIGNLSFYAEEDDLWKLFENCGPIQYVRIIRDNRTGIGKGFGYVNFKNVDSVSLALEMEKPTLKNRELRIGICNNNQMKKKKPKTRKNKSAKPKTDKKIDDVKSTPDSKPVNSTGKDYEGSKVVNQKRKKAKMNKGLLKKKKIIKQIAPK